MNRWVFLSSAILLALSAIHAEAVDAPHAGTTSGIACTTCHTPHLELGTSGSKAYNNICISCHRPGNPTAGGKPMTLSDSANPFGNISTLGLNGLYQTSHAWSGSDTNPAAGALPPLQAAMTSATLRTRTGGQLACVRCHDQHSNANGKFLRVANNTDQLCMDCHRTRNVQNHLGGSHPVNVNYSSVRAAKPTLFNKTPKNANPANTTSDLGGQLAKSSNTLLCSTCHSVHYADSRSSTVDGAAQFANLSSGDGFLLRTDRRGAAVASDQVDGINICTNCHAGKKNHNLKGQDIQCSDCHGAHVEYDSLAPNAVPNIYLIRRTMQKGAAGRVVFTAGQQAYKKADGTGVCQGCHAVPTGAGFPPAHSYADAIATDCNGCHSHTGSSGSFSVSGACDSCHGYPPVSSMAGLGVIGNFANARLEDYAGGGGHHTTHLAASVAATDGFTPCLPCHPSTTHNQGGGTVARANVQINVAPRFDDTRTTRYNTAAATCSNISCHYKPTPAW